MKKINLNTLLGDLNEIESWGRCIKPERKIYHTKFHSFRVIIEEKKDYSITNPSIMESPNQPITSYHLRLLRDKKILQEHYGDRIKTLYETIDNKFK